MSVWRALFPAGSAPGSSGKPVGLKKTQLALVWFSAKPCLFKFVLGALRGQPAFNRTHMGFLERPSSANKRSACFLSFEERNSGVWGGQGWPVTWVLSPGTQQLLWKQDSLPVSPDLRDFLGKLVFAGASMKGRLALGVTS